MRKKVEYLTSTSEASYKFSEVSTGPSSGMKAFDVNEAQSSGKHVFMCRRCS